MAKKSVKPANNAQKSASIRVKRKPRGKAFEPGNPYRIKPGEVRNPGGRPRLLSDAYRAQLATVVPTDPEGRTYAELIASGRITAAIDDTGAAREVRQATEGERIRTWRDDVIDLLRKGEITPDDVIAEFGADEAGPLIIASGIRRDESGSPEGESGAQVGEPEDA